MHNSQIYSISTLSSIQISSRIQHNYYNKQTGHFGIFPAVFIVNGNTDRLSQHSARQNPNLSTIFSTCMNFTWLHHQCHIIHTILRASKSHQCGCIPLILLQEHQIIHFETSVISKGSCQVLVNLKVDSKFNLLYY